MGVPNVFYRVTTRNVNIVPPALCSVLFAVCGALLLMATSVSVTVLYRGSLIATVFFWGSRGLAPLSLAVGSGKKRRGSCRTPESWTTCDGSHTSRRHRVEFRRQLGSGTVVASCSDRTRPRELRLGQRVAPSHSNGSVRVPPRARTLVAERAHHEQSPSRVATRRDTYQSRTAPLVRPLMRLSSEFASRIIVQWSTQDPSPLSSPAWPGDRLTSA